MTRHPLPHARALRLALLLAPVGLPGTTAHAAATPGWEQSLAQRLTAAPDTAWTNLDLLGRLAPAIGFNQAGCSTARLPNGGGSVPVTAAMVLYDHPDACDQPTNLLTLQLDLQPVSPSDRTRLIQALSSHAGRPCFAGEQRLNPRSRARPARITAWRLNAYTIAFVTQPELIDTLTVSIVATGAGAPTPSPAAQQTRSSLLDSLPAPCR